MAYQGTPGESDYNGTVEATFQVSEQRLIRHESMITNVQENIEMEEKISQILTLVKLSHPVITVSIRQQILIRTLIPYLHLQNEMWGDFISFCR
jgi:hypothetical protein